MSGAVSATLSTMKYLHDFLQENEKEILRLTEEKTLDLTGARSSSDQLKQGLPVFFRQLLGILDLERPLTHRPSSSPEALVKGADEADEQAIALAANQPEEAELAMVAGLHGIEMFRLGYTLSHVVHAYGAMCQSITELAELKDFPINAAGFHELNQCLAVAFAGAVTEYEKLRDRQEKSREDQHLGFLAHELRNALASVTISLQIIKKGTVGLSGSTGRVLDKGLKRMQDLIDRSLTDVRLRVDPTLHVEADNLLRIVDQIMVSASVEADLKKQKIEFRIDPNLTVVADQQAFYSALSNLIQNAIKFTPPGGKIQIRGQIVQEKIRVEVEDDCGGLLPDQEKNLFKAFEQGHENKTGLGLGLTIAQRAIVINHGTLEVRNLPGKGCIFIITLPKAIHVPA